MSNDIYRKNQPSAEKGEIMTQKKFLVTGATGATGGYAVERLLERGHAVRALAHREDNRSKRLDKMGAEVVIGDFLKFNDVRAAMRGVRGPYFGYPIRPAFCKEPRYVRPLVGRTALRLVRPHRRPPARLPQNSGIADAARTDRSDGRYRAGGGLLRFIRFEMDHRRNTTHRGRSSLGIYRK